MKSVMSGWWDQVCMRDGWSNKIGKWQWVTLQTIIPWLILLPIGLVAIWYFDGISAREFFLPLLIMMPTIALFQSGGWKRDQRKMLEKETEETVVL